MLEFTSNNKKIYKALDDEGFVKDVKICDDAILSVDIYDAFIPGQASKAKNIFSNSETQTMSGLKLESLKSIFNNPCKGVWMKKDDLKGYLTLVVK